MAKNIVSAQAWHPGSGLFGEIGHIIVQLENGVTDVLTAEQFAARSTLPVAPAPAPTAGLSAMVTKPATPAPTQPAPVTPTAPAAAPTPAPAAQPAAPSPTPVAPAAAAPQPAAQVAATPAPSAAPAAPVAK